MCCIKTGLLFTFVFYLIKLSKADIAYVHIYRESITESRGCRLPQQVRVSVRVDNETLSLELTRNEDVDSNVPLYLLRDIKTTNTVVKEHLMDTQRKAQYQDVTKNAAMTISCFGEDTHLHLQLRGILTVHGKEYQLESKSRDRRETPRDEEEYILEKQPVTFAGDDYVEIHEEAKSSVSGRNKRETTEYYIDVLTVIDYAIYQREYNRTDSTLSSEDRKSKTLQNIREYFAYVMNGVNLRYKRITGLGFHLVIRLTGYVVGDTRDKSPWTENNVTMTPKGGEIDSAVALSNLKSWVASTSLPENDHVMLFSGYDFFRIKQNVKNNLYHGLTHLKRMCRSEGLSTSVIEDFGGFQSIHTATHELGHSLGARHDGDGNSCSANDQYIMAAIARYRTDPNNTNHWTFSKCSLTYFNSYMTSLMNTPYGRKCLTEKVTKDKVPSVDDFPGQKYSPDAQCQRIYGPKSNVCRGLTFDPDYSRVCFILYCLNPDGGLCHRYEAARGTTCGNKKWCINGLCVSSPDAPSVDETCPFGDEPGNIYGGKTCEKYISDAGSRRCYEDVFRKRCCHSCGLHKTGIPDCLYGDKMACSKQMCGKNYTVQNTIIVYDIHCCKTCAPETKLTTATNTKTELTTSTTTNKPCFDVGYFEGLNCSQYVDMKGSFVCFESRVEKECCAKCASVATSVEGCKYGDRNPWICDRAISRWIGCLVEQSFCCMSCKKNGASTLQASYSVGRTTFLASIFLLYKQFALQN